MEQAAAFADADDYKDRVRAKAAKYAPARARRPPSTAVSASRSYAPHTDRAFASALSVSNSAWRLTRILPSRGGTGRDLRLWQRDAEQFGRALLRAINGGGLHRGQRWRHRCSRTTADHCGDSSILQVRRASASARSTTTSASTSTARSRLTGRRSDTNGDAAAAVVAQATTESSSGGFRRRRRRRRGRPSGDADASGAIAEGPPLTGPPTVEQSPKIEA